MPEGILPSLVFFLQANRFSKASIFLLPFSAQNAIHMDSFFEGDWLVISVQATRCLCDSTSQTIGKFILNASILAMPRLVVYESPWQWRGSLPPLPFRSFNFATNSILADAGPMGLPVGQSIGGDARNKIRIWIYHSIISASISSAGFFYIGLSTSTITSKFMCNGSAIPTAIPLSAKLLN